ncbi:GAP family protein [Streptomyces sp. NPDC050264]|uniref:GAP family protein n=1 Tax=Streptomyces sp. NPDC050264 TaxID=3155038 RepID=UPI00342737A1
MGQTLGDVMGYAAGVAISPLPIVAVILILATPRARLNGTLFVIGWLVGLSALGVVMLVIGGSAGSSTGKQPATWVGGLKTGLGILLVLFAVRHWRRRPADASQAQLPKWMAAVDRFTPVKTLGLGLALSAANLKNAPLTVAAGATISSSGIPAGQQAASLAVFVAIASLGLLVPLAAFLLMGERARRTLDSWKDWAVRHNTAVMAVLFFVLGLKLLGDGIGILA